MDSEELLAYNPKLKDYTPMTRMAYARFKHRLADINEKAEE